MGRNGEVAWATMPAQGTQAVPLEQMKPINEMATVQFFMTQLADEYGTIETLDDAEAMGQECLRLKLSDQKDPGPSEPKGDYTLYINKKSSLPVMLETPPQDGQTTHAKFEDFKKVGDLKLFTKITMESARGAQSLTIENLGFNEVDDALFEIPEGVAGPTTQPSGG